MLNLEGMELIITVPVSSLERMGNIDSTEKIESFFEGVVRYVESKDSLNLTDNALNVLKNEYLKNIIFLPIIVKNMIITNKKFSEVVQLSKDEFEKNFSEIEHSISENNLNYEKISLYFCQLLNFNKPNMIIFKLNKLSEKFSRALSIYGADQILERVVVKVYDNINNSLNIPIKQAVNEAYTEIFEVVKKKRQIKLENEEKEKIINCCNNSLEERCKKQCIAIPLQVIISEVVIKAITEDLTFMDALLLFDFKELVEKTVQEIEQETSLLNTNEIKELTKQVMITALNLK